MTDVLQPAAATSPAPPDGTDAASVWPEGLPKRMTLEEYLDWDYEGVRAEWVDGEVVLMSPVRLDHQFLVQFLYELIVVFARKHSLGKVLLAPTRMRLPTKPTGREPDLLFVSTPHLNRLKENHVDGPADLVVEIVSPESEVRDRATKFNEYEAAGIPEYWLIDSLRHEALFYLLGDDGRYHLRMPSSDGIYQSRTLEGFRLRPDWLWRDPLPTPEAARAELPA
jgi:Uma2 family endonuclease